MIIANIKSILPDDEVIEETEVIMDKNNYDVNKDQMGQAYIVDR